MKVSTGKAYEWLFPEKSKQTQRTSYQNQVLPYYVVPQKTVPLLSCSYYPTLQQLFEVFTVSRASQSKVLYCSIMSDNWNFPTCHYLSNNFQAFKPSGGQTHSFSTDLHSQSTRLWLLSSLTKLEQPWCVLIVIAAVSSIEDFSFFSLHLPPLPLSLPSHFIVYWSNRQNQWMRAPWRKWSWPLRKGRTKIKNWGLSFPTTQRSKLSLSHILISDGVCELNHI